MDGVWWIVRMLDRSYCEWYGLIWLVKERPGVGGGVWCLIWRWGCGCSDADGAY